MEKKKVLLALPLLFFMLGMGNCSSFKYEPDLGFINSAQANSMEWLLFLDGKTCKDMEGRIGACTKRVKSNAAIQFRHDPRPYPYRIDVRCTQGTGVGFSMDVEAGAAWSYEMPADRFQGFRSFSCQGEIFPHDRPQNLSALWQVRFLVVDAAYRERELIYRAKSRMVFGRHAKYVRVCEKEECETYSKAPVVKAAAGARGYSESELLRFNYSAGY